MVASSPAAVEPVIDTLLAEYSACSERYENIYKAVWQNFSYLTIVSGAFLSFGTTFSVDWNLTALVACLPLIFWYLATFLPMNSYGDQVLRRLQQVELELSRISGLPIRMYSNFTNRNTWRKIFPSPSTRTAVYFTFNALFVIAGLLLVNSLLVERKFDFDSISQPVQLLTQLKFITGSGPKTEAQDAIRAGLQSKTITEIEAASEGAGLNGDLARRVISDLNRLAYSPSLSRNQQFTALDDQFAYNSRIIEEALAGTIKPSQFRWQTIAFLKITLGVAVLVYFLGVHINLILSWKDRKRVMLLCAQQSGNNFTPYLKVVSSKHDVDELLTLKFYKLNIVEGQEVVLNNESEMIEWSNSTGPSSISLANIKNKFNNLS